MSEYRIIPSCEKCLYDRQVNIASQLSEQDAENYLKEIRDILDNRDKDDCSPYMVYLFNKVQKKYGIPSTFFAKQKYNDIVLAMEEEIADRIENSRDSLMTSLKFARIGNYIDFGAMNEVKTDVLYELLDKEDASGLEEDSYRQFCEQCEKGKNFVLLCDNCGEIVLDKLFIIQLKKTYPHLNIDVIVRGEPVLNDATIEDAIYCGFDKVVNIIPNGNAVAGTITTLLSEEAREAIDNADVILSKGQGNYESFSGQGRDVFYSFLCKCELFTNRFNVPRLTGMFIREQ